MRTEEKLVDWISKSRIGEFSPAALETVKNQFLTIVGTVVAGATEDGCEEAVRLYRDLGGKKEATILIHGGKIPAHDAAFVNGVMGRSLDLCDSMTPGPHVGAALITASLSAAEAVGGMSGIDFLTAIAIGNEVAARMNLSEAAYDGFDPTGICVIFGVAAAVSRILGLSKKRPGMPWPLPSIAAEAVSRAISTALSASVSSRDGWLRAVFCAPALASQGITGPKNFLDGVYGYLHLYGKDLLKARRRSSPVSARNSGWKRWSTRNIPAAPSHRGPRRRRWPSCLRRISCGGYRSRS